MKYRFLRFPNFKQKAVTLSYDDGVQYDAKLIEIMRKYGLKGTFNINSGLFSPEDGGRRMSKREAYDLYANSGMEVAVHGVKHYSLGEVNSMAVVKEVAEDRENLEEMFSRIVRGMAYANGSTSDEAVLILKACGIAYARTTVSTEKFDIPTDWLRLPATCHHGNPRLMELAKEFVEIQEGEGYMWRWNHFPKLFYLWGHSYEFNDNNNWEIIEEFAKYVGNREDIWYATNGEIYDYVKAYDQLIYSANGKKIYNPTATDIYLNYFGVNVFVPAGK
ncbi:MAG: polysaccharide deacetylase family protein, partial [Clostridia bacterium]|nr:polysaccharide deacetylase family protein [Clostridia bacterium]